jgi:hypothetical protein
LVVKLGKASKVDSQLQLEVGPVKPLRAGKQFLLVNRLETVLKEY